MNLNQININQLLQQIQALAVTVVGFVLAILLLGTSVKMMGHAIPYVPSVGEQPLAWICGAYYLYRK
jgi:hypothetical protein